MTKKIAVPLTFSKGLRADVLIAHLNTMASFVDRPLTLAKEPTICDVTGLTGMHEVMWSGDPDKVLWSRLRIAYENFEKGYDYHAELQGLPTLFEANAIAYTRDHS